jgi:hypothetical protein
MRIVDESFPSDRGTGLFEIGAHDDEQPVAQCIGHWFQSVGIFVGGFGIMDRTGADDDEQPFSVLAMQNTADSVSGFHDQRGGLIGNR